MMPSYQITKRGQSINNESLTIVDEKSFTNDDEAFNWMLAVNQRSLGYQVTDIKRIKPTEHQLVISALMKDVMAPC